MARRKSDLPLQKVTLNLVTGDYAKMQALFPSLGGGAAIRTLVNNYIKSIQKALQPLDIPLVNPDDLKDLIND